MKKIIFMLLSITLLNFAYAQEQPYLIRAHYIEVEGDVNAFIKANSEFYKKMAQLAVKDEKWDGWQMWQSNTNQNQFVFFHHFKNPKQLEDWNWDWTSDENVKKARVKRPDQSVFKMIMGSMETYQLISTALSGTDSKYFIMNQYKASNWNSFIENNKLWGELYVTPQLEKNPGLNWGFGMKVVGNHTENGKMMNYNGVSWDGFPSLADLINAQAYSEDKWESDANFQAFSKAVNELDLGNFSDAKKQSVWRVLDTSWN